MKVAARFTVYLSAAVDPGDDGMSEMWDRVHDALDSVPGVFGEGGRSAVMEPGDLIPDSPLDLYIKAAS